MVIADLTMRIDIESVTQRMVREVKARVDEQYTEVLQAAFDAGYALGVDDEAGFNSNITGSSTPPTFEEWLASLIAESRLP